MRAQVAICRVVQFRGREIAQFNFFYASCGVPQDFSRPVDASHDIEETGRVLTSSVQFLPVLILPLMAVTFPVARPNLP